MVGLNDTIKQGEILKFAKNYLKKNNTTKILSVL